MTAENLVQKCNSTYFNMAHDDDDDVSLLSLAGGTKVPTVITIKIMWRMSARTVKSNLQTYQSVFRHSRELYSDSGESGAPSLNSSEHVFRETLSTDLIAYLFIYALFGTENSIVM